MADRLKLPAFARFLLENRRRGFHPLRVALVYGDDRYRAWRQQQAEREAVQVHQREPYTRAWLEQFGDPMIAIEPRDYQPAMYDFRCVAGCGVRVFDQLEAARDCDCQAGHWGRFYDLLAELAHVAGEVVIAGRPDVKVDDLAFAHRRGGAWPRWWSDDLQKEYDRRNYIFFHDELGARQRAA